MGAAGLQQCAGKPDEQLLRQVAQPFFGVWPTGQILMLDIIYQPVELRKVFGIQHLIYRYVIFFLPQKIGGKMNVAVPEFAYRLIILTKTGGIQNTGVFLCCGDFAVNAAFHRGFPQQKKIITAAAGTVNAEFVSAGTVVLTIIDAKHRREPPCR